MTFDQLRELVRAYEAEHSVSEGKALRAIIAMAALAMCKSLPSSLRPGLFVAASQALGIVNETAALQPIRVEAWQFLDTKNGNSTTIADATDRAGRLLIAIAWDEEVTPGDLPEIYDFVLGLINDQPGLSGVLTAG